MCDRPDRTRLCEAVTEDPELTAAEKETTLGFTKADDTVRVYTAEAGLMRRFLSHPEAEVDSLTLLEGDARPAVSPDEYESGMIVGAVLDLPVGVLQTKLKPRQTPHHAEIVTDRVLSKTGGSDD